MNDYQTKLKDPRWQKKRLEILNRDKWACCACLSTEETLVVHHKDYISNTEPWDYPDYKPRPIEICEKHCKE